MAKYPNKYTKTSFLKVINTPKTLEYSDIILKILYHFSNVDFEKEFLNDNELNRLINQSAKFQLAPYISYMENLRKLMLFEGRDLKGLSKIEGIEDIEKRYSVLINRISEENLNLLTLKEKGIREDINGYLIFNNIIKELVEKKVIEIKSGKPLTKTIILKIYNRLKEDKIYNAILDKILETPRYKDNMEVSEDKNYNICIKIKSKKTKAEAIVEYTNSHPDLSYSQVAQNLNTSRGYVKKVMFNFAKLVTQKK